MTPRLSALVLMVLSICYGIVVGILGSQDSSATATVAVVGALVLGGLWVLRSVLMRGRST